MRHSLQCSEALKGTKMALTFVIAGWLTLTPPTTAFAADIGTVGCGLDNLFTTTAGSLGPLDYRVATPSQRHLVESNHFTAPVESLQHGKTATTPGPDIAYTLSVYPNHARALKAMMQLGFRNNTERPEGAAYTVECYFARSLRFAPDDLSVRMVYALYLHGKGQNSAALDELLALSKIAGDNGNLHYNLGLIYFELKKYDQALDEAHIAYRMGFQLPGLRDKLKRLGKWREPESADAG